LNKEQSEPSVECDLAGDLPLQSDELQLLQDLLPELIKDLLRTTGEDSATK
jgi:hypothetical protein